MYLFTSSLILLHYQTAYDKFGMIPTVRVAATSLTASLPLGLRS